MTNREYLNTLNDEDFSVTVLRKANDVAMQTAEDNPDFDAIDAIEYEQMLFEDWLQEEK